MGRSIDTAGKTGSRSLTDLSARAAAFGAALTSGAAILGQWSRNAQDAAAVQRGLEQAIANTGSSFDAYADRIRAAGDAAVQLGIDDEKAFQAIAALTEITGNAGTAIDLLGTAEDLAAAKGMDLVSAAEVIGRVHEGNVGILQRYGIVVDKNATSEQALAQIQQQTAGQAEAHATTYARLREEFSNVTDAIGGAVGGFAPFLQMLPALSSGVTLFGAAIGALAPELTAAGAAAAVLDVALGPVGIALAAGVAVVAIYELTKGHDAEAKAAAGAKTETDGLTASINRLAAAGNANAQVGAVWKADFEARAAATLNLSDTIGDLEQQIAVLRTAQQQPGTDNQAQIDALEQQRAALAELLALYGDGAAANREYGETEAALTAIIEDTGTGAAAAQAEAAKYHDELLSGQLTVFQYEQLIQELGGNLGMYDTQANAATAATKALALAATGTADGLDAIKQASDGLTRTFADTAAGQKLLADLQTIGTLGTDAQIEATQRQTDALLAGTMGWEAYAGSVHLTASVLTAGTRSLATMRAANDELARSLAATQAGYDANTRALAEWNGAQTVSLDAMRATNAESSRQLAIQAQGTAANQRALAEFNAEELAQTAVAEAARATTITVEDFNATLEAQAAAAFDAAQALGVLGTFIEQIRTAPIEVRGPSRAGGAAADLARITTGMGAALGIFKTLDNLNQQATQAGSIAENLVGKPGEWAVIDDLLQHGQISQSRYNQTVEAGYRIQQRQASVEQDLNTIRAKQLPLLDEQDQAYQRQIDTISHMGAAEQQVALGFMDATEATKVQTAVTLAADAANTKVGSSARQAAEAVIQGAAEADPVFAAMAESIGLITTDKEGHITVNFDNADTLQGSIDALTGSISALTAAIGLLPPTAATDVQVTGDDAAVEAGNVNALAGALHAADGTHAETSLTNTITTNEIHNQIINKINPLARLGGVIGYALGGAVMPVELAEAGPELLHFRGGGSALVRQRGIYGVPVGTYVDTADATAAKRTGGHQFNFTIAGDVHGFAGVDEVFAAFARAARTHFAGMGV